MVVHASDEAEKPKEKGKDDGLFHDMDQASKRRSCFSCGNCAIVLVLGLILLVIGILAAVAATGVIRIPLLSPLVYQTPPGPTRVVEPTGPADAGVLIQEKLKNPAILKSRTVGFTEGELTQLLRDPGSDGEVFLKQGQVAVDAGQAEIYGQITIMNNPLVVRVELEPTTSNQSLAVTELALGRVTIPRALTATASRIVMDMVLSQMQLEPTTTLTDIGVQNLSLTPGVLSVTASAALIETLQSGAEASAEFPSESDLEAAAGETSSVE